MIVVSSGKFEKYTKKIYSKITVLVFEVFMHKQSVKIQKHLCWKFKVRVLKKNSDNPEIIPTV